MIAWFVVLGINSTRNAGNLSRLRLVKITSLIARAINPYIPQLIMLLYIQLPFIEISEIFDGRVRIMFSWS